jgi:hypothetical protein
MPRNYAVIRADPELMKAESMRTSALHKKKYHSDPEYRARQIAYAKARYARIKAEKMKFVDDEEN